MIKIVVKIRGGDDAERREQTRPMMIQISNFKDEVTILMIGQRYNVQNMDEK